MSLFDNHAKRLRKQATRQLTNRADYCDLPLEQILNGLASISFRATDKRDGCGDGFNCGCRLCVRDYGWDPYPDGYGTRRHDPPADDA